MFYLPTGLLGFLLVRGLLGFIKRGIATLLLLILYNIGILTLEEIVLKQMPLELMALCMFWVYWHFLVLDTCVNGIDVYRTLLFLGSMALFVFLGVLTVGQWRIH